MAVKYTDMTRVLLDVDLYLASLNGSQLDLGLLPQIAQNRWTWIVQNWTTLFQRFVVVSNGNDIFTAILENFNNSVISYNLGSNLNPLTSYQNFTQFKPFLTQIKLSELAVSNDEAVFIQNELQRVSEFNIETFRAMVFFIRQQIAIASYDIGLGDADGSKLYGVVPKKRSRPAQISDLEQMEDVLGIQKFIEGIIVDFRGKSDVAPDLIKIANESVTPDTDVKFNDAYKSSIAVPFEISLEHMAQKYLGDEQLYFELVTINKLQPPYFDEVGTKLLLLAPGAVNNLIINSSLVTSMPVGTKIKIGSFRVKEEARIIEKVVDNQDGTLIVYLSGDQDLIKFLPKEGAFVRVYSPGTVNSGSFVLIPLTLASSNRASYTPQSDELRRLDAALLNFGVDIKRDEKTGGFVVDSNGNFKYAAGLANVRQAVLYALKTTRGELPMHKDYGVTINIGGRYYGTVDEAVVFANALRFSLLSDARFSDIKIAGLATTGTGISLTLLVSIAGLGAPIPLSFVS